MPSGISIRCTPNPCLLVYWGFSAHSYSELEAVKAEENLNSSASKDLCLLIAKERTYEGSLFASPYLNMSDERCYSEDIDS